MSGGHQAVSEGAQGHFPALPSWSLHHQHFPPLLTWRWQNLGAPLNVLLLQETLNRYLCVSLHQHFCSLY